MAKILLTINRHNYFIPKMNLKAIVATLEENYPNLFDQLGAWLWLVAALGRWPMGAFLPLVLVSFLWTAALLSSSSAASWRLWSAAKDGLGSRSSGVIHGQPARGRALGREAADYSIRLSMRQVKLFGRNVQPLVD